MKAALEAYLTTLNRGTTHREAVLAAAHAMQARPADVVGHAGLLARCRTAIAPVATGLTSSLRRVPIGSRAAIVRVRAGGRYPVVANKGRYAAGVHDPPVDLARRVVEQCLAASDGIARVGVDIACGSGAFLVAMSEAGLTELYGMDTSALCLEVAAVACPSARLLRDEPTKHGPPADLLVGAAPYTARSDLDAARRFDFRHRFPWLGRTLDVVSGFAAAASERARPGGGIGLLLPTDSLVRPHGALWRARFVTRHRVVELVGPLSLPGVRVDASILVAQAGCGPAPLPAYGVTAAEALGVDNVVLDAERRPGDIATMSCIEQHSVPLGDLATISGGVHVVGPGETVPADLVTSQPGEGRVPFAESRGFFAGDRRWLLFKPARLHRATSREIHERPKVVAMRSRARGGLRCEVDRSGVFIGASLTSVVPLDDGVSPESVHALLSTRAVEGWLRVRHGRVTDLTPRVLAEIPFPKAWLGGVSGSLSSAWGVSKVAMESLEDRAQR